MLNQPQNKSFRGVARILFNGVSMHMAKRQAYIFDAMVDGAALARVLMHTLFDAHAVTVGEWNGLIPKVAHRSRPATMWSKKQRHMSGEQNYWKA